MTNNPPAKSARQPHTRTDRVAGKLKTALDLMVYGGADGIPLDYDVAARTANLTVR